MLRDALLRANGIKKRAAVMLGIDPRNMPYLLRKHRLGDSLRSR
ncbi:MAG: helix-turn-helix domain-containing protein [Gammaproteobacteria bacterium]